MTRSTLPSFPPITLWFNPKCSKSRRTQELLERCGASVTIFDYQATPPSREQLEGVLQKLEQTPRAIVRSKDELFRSEGLEDASDERLLAALCEHPQLIERPIGLTDTMAVVARPPERIFDLCLEPVADRKALLEQLK